MEELFFDIYERRFNPANYSKAVIESAGANNEQKKEKEMDLKKD